MAFCECGCGENAKNRFVNGHNKNRLGRNKYNDAGCSRVSNARIGKGNSNWRGGISKRLDSGVVRFCECGCGQRVKSWQRFVSGHNLRVPETVLKMKLRVAEAHRTFEARERARKRFVEDNPRKRPEAREAMRGENNIAKRLEVRKKISENNSMKRPEIVAKRSGDAHPAKRLEVREKMSQSIKRYFKENPKERERYQGERNPMKRLDIRTKAMNSRYKKQTTKRFERGEESAYKYLCELGLEVEHVYPIGQYHADIFIRPNIVVEIDGPGHQGRAARQRDQIKDAVLCEKGYRVFRVNDQEVESDPENCLAHVLQEVS